MPDAKRSVRPERIVTAVLAAQVACFLMFVAGAALSIWTFARNSQNGLNCFGNGACSPHHSYILGIVLLAVGFVGGILVGAVASRLVAGMGINAYRHYRRQRSGLL